MPLELIVKNKQKPVVFAEKKRGILSLGQLGEGFEDRNHSILQLIQLTDEKFNLPDFNTIYVHTGDHEHSDFIGCFYFCYGKHIKECFPDFNFLHWKNVGVFDYESTIQEIRTKVDLNKYQEMKVGWVGALNGSWHKRRVLYKLGQENPDILDIINIGGWEKKGGYNHLIPGSCKFHSYLELAQKYTILLDIEGGGYSGRLKYLLHTGRPVIVVDRVPKEFFYPFMKPWEHYIPVENDLSDLIEKTKWIIDNYQEAAEIGLNGKEFANIYLTRDYALQHIKNLIVKENTK
jgi:hypothetical protein|tara:strand:- start:493 stop:1362 length:870 start_codon:yes stop_codon:yes gene_type:complete